MWLAWTVRVPSRRTPPKSVPPRTRILQATPPSGSLAFRTPSARPRPWTAAVLVLRGHGAPRTSPVGAPLHKPALGSALLGSDSTRYPVAPLQGLQLVHRKVAPLAWSKPLVGDLGVRDAGQSKHLGASGFTKPSHLTIAPLVNRDLEPRLVPFPPQPPHARRLCCTSVDDNALAPAVESRVFDPPGHLDDVGLGHLAARMHERCRKVAVIRHQEDAARAEIQPPNRNEAPRPLDELRNRWAPLRIMQRGDVTARLVQQDVGQRLRHQTPPVELDALRPQIGLGTELGDDFSVNLDSTAYDELLRCPARRDPSSSE